MSSESRSNWAGCRARLPDRCSICWRQEMPGATTSVSAAAAWTAGASRRLPSVTVTVPGADTLLRPIYFGASYKTLTEEKLIGCLKLRNNNRRRRRD